MQLLVLKYIPILCITIFSGNVKCDKYVMQQEEAKIFKISSCAAQCINDEMGKDLTECYEDCRKRENQLPEVEEMGDDFNVTYGLHCRDATKIVLKFSSSVENDTGTFLYLIKIYKTKDEGPKEIILTSDAIVEIHELQPSTLYVISTTVITADNQLKHLESKNISTSNIEFQPQNITHFTNMKFTYNKSTNLLDLSMEWKPEIDFTCVYDVHFFDSDIHDPVEIRNVSHLYKYKYKGLEFDTDYQYGVTSGNLNTSVFSEVHWQQIRSPKCKEFFKEQPGYCPITNINITTCTYHPIRHSFFDVVVEWEINENLPKYYFLKLFTPPNITYYKKLNAAATSAIFEDVYINHHFSIFISAISELGNYTYAEQYMAETVKFHINYMLIFGLCVAVILCSLSIYALFYIYKKRIFRINSDDIPLKNLNVFLKTAKIDDFNELFAISNDPLEIPRENIKIFELLGEGNFGFVKKALILNDGKGDEVAVKMLKENASLADLRQFRLEIDMMKSVGKHPNIIRIIGHCTKRVEELLLITEYCAKGNLSNYLKFELDKLRINRIISTPRKSPENVFNFDRIFNKKTTSYKNLDESLTYLKSLNNENNENTVVPNNSDTNNNKNNSWAEKIISVWNPLYLEWDEKNSPTPSQMMQVQVEVTNELLLHFAKQIAEGMHFLAKSKIVHRDLAARNVLICSDNTAKIADFGLSRDIYQDNLYKKTGAGKLPIKWLALECMTHQVYTSQSDIWSFGILLMEIVTLGGMPYPSISVENLLASLQKGYRMERPKQCSLSLYNVMLQCWKESPRDRTSFKKLHARLQELSKQPFNHIDLDIIFNDAALINSPFELSKMQNNYKV